MRRPDSASEDDYRRESKSDAEHDGVVPVSARVRTGYLCQNAHQLDQYRSEMIERSLRAEPAARRDALVELLFTNAIGAFDLFSVYLGDRLGLYLIVADRGPLTSAELAAAAGLHERYVREWLEHEGAICSRSRRTAMEGNGGSPCRRGHDEALVDVSSLNYVAPMARSVLGSIRPIDALLVAFETGEGVPYAAYGDDLHEGQAGFTRPLFERLLGKEWLPSVPQLHERLLADPPARVADIACGQGRSSIELARVYPKVTVDGIDSDRASIGRARESLVGSGVEDRVTFHERDAAGAELAGRYDLVTIFETLHDMSFPVEVLRSAGRALAEDGVVLIGDERTEDTYTTPAPQVERLYYGFSVFHCLPVGMVGDGAAGTGTVMRPEAVRRYADEAGFSSCDVVPIESDFWRFYLLTPKGSGAPGRGGRRVCRHAAVTHASL